MRLDIAAFAATCALLWGGAILLVAVGHALSPEFGGAFLELVASVYPGYEVGRTVGSVAVGTLYGVVDGAIGGAAFAWLYNLLSRRFASRVG